MLPLCHNTHPIITAVHHEVQLAIDSDVSNFPVDIQSYAFYLVRKSVFLVLLQEVTFWGWHHFTQLLKDFRPLHDYTHCWKRIRQSTFLAWSACTLLIRPPESVTNGSYQSTLVADSNTTGRSLCSKAPNWMTWPVGILNCTVSQQWCWRNVYPPWYKKFYFPDETVEIITRSKDQQVFS